MIEIEPMSAEEESALLQEWFETVQFDHPSEGIPELDPEDDDEEPESRNTPVEEYKPVADLSTVDMDTLMEELRNRDPDNPF